MISVIVLGRVLLMTVGWSIAKARLIRVSAGDQQVGEQL